MNPAREFMGTRIEHDTGLEDSPTVEQTIILIVRSQVLQFMIHWDQLIWMRKTDYIFRWALCLEFLFAFLVITAANAGEPNGLDQFLGQF